MNNPSATFDQYSLRSLSVETFRDNRSLGKATASLWLIPEMNSARRRSFIVTNWHVLTGLHRRTNEFLRNDQECPNRIEVSFHTTQPGSERRAVQSFDLYDPDMNPKWIEHPDKSKKVDLAALEFEVQQPVNPFYVNVSYMDEASHKQDMALRVGSDVFVIGFPLSPNLFPLPIWKRASVASEPELSLVDKRGYFLVDTTTRGGMSGSIVLQRSYGGYLSTDGDFNVVPEAESFIGIYSGRLDVIDSDKVSLGFVWPRRTLEELFASPVPGSRQ